MDIGPPLIDHYARVSATADDSPAGVRSRRSLQAALQQWRRAYAHISRKRREAVNSATDPRVEYLLKDETIFTSGKEAREHLFTGESIVNASVSPTPLICNGEIGARLHFFP